MLPIPAGGAMADAGKEAPECKAGHGSMRIAVDQNGRPTLYAAGVDHSSAFIIYQCAVCSYVEVHDSVLPVSAPATPNGKVVPPPSASVNVTAPSDEGTPPGGTERPR